MNEVTRTGLGGNTFVVGTVYAPSGRPIGYRLRIKLVSNVRGDIIASTDDRGQFVFSGVSAGQYDVVIDSESEFEPYSQHLDVDVGRSTSPLVFTLNLRLSERRHSGPKPGVVSASDAGASKKSASLYKEAVERAKSDDHQGAIEKLKLAIADSPKYVSALNELGAQYMIINDLASAETILREATTLDPKAEEPIINLGICLFRQKRYDKAQEQLSKGLAIDARSAVAHFYMGRTYMSLEKADDAIRELIETVTLSGEQFKETHRLLASLYIGKRERAKVVDELEIYLRLVPNAKDADELRQIIKQNKAAPPK